MKNSEKKVMKKILQKCIQQERNKWQMKRKHEIDMKWNYSCHVNTLVVYYIIILLSGTHFVSLLRNQSETKTNKQQHRKLTKIKKKKQEKIHIKNTINIQKLKY